MASHDLAGTISRVSESEQMPDGNGVLEEQQGAESNVPFNTLMVCHFPPAIGLQHPTRKERGREKRKDVL